MNTLSRFLVLAVLFGTTASAQTNPAAQQNPPQNNPGGSGQGQQAPVPIPEHAALKAVPHGEIRIMWYASKALGIQRRMHVYLPPGYERSRDKYPVLYLIHGGGEDDAAWANGGRAGMVFDNLLAEGKAKPMIVVMPSAGSTNPTLNRPSTDATPEALAARVASSNEVRDGFINDLLTGIIPHVESSYRVQANRDSRAIAGFSFGGAESLWTGVRHTDKFAWIAAFAMGIQGDSKSSPGSVAGSGSAANPEGFVKENATFFADSSKTNKMVKLFWIGVGRDDTVVTNGPKQLANTLSTHGIRHEYHEYDGGHNMSNRNLPDFAALLFR